MGVKVTFQVGNRSGLVKDGDRFGQEQLMDALGGAVAQKAKENSHVDVGHIRKVLGSRIEKSLQVALATATNNLVGSMSSPPTPGQGRVTQKIYYDMGGDIPRPAINPTKGTIQEMSNPSYVEWAPLTSQTLKKKAMTAVGNKRKNPPATARRYYVHTGALQNELRGLAKNIVSKTGTVQLYYIKDNAKDFSKLRSSAKRIRVGRLRIKFLPKIKVRDLPGLQSGDPADFTPNMLFEASLGITNESIKKLRGASFAKGEGLAHRPLLQPIFTYWALSRIPRLVATSIAAGILTTSRSGIEDMSSGGF